MMRFDRNQRGEGRIGLVITLVLIAIAVFVGMQYIPAKVNAYEFSDYLEKECRFAATRRNDEAIEKRILEKAEELGLPLKRKNLKVRRSVNEIIITARYEQPLDFKVMTYRYKFDHTEKAPLF